MYDPRIGQFLSPDPIEDDLTHERRAMGNNPTNNVDPDGLATKSSLEYEFVHGGNSYDRHPEFRNPETEVGFSELAVFWKIGRSKNPILVGKSTHGNFSSSAQIHAFSSIPYERIERVGVVQLFDNFGGGVVLGKNLETAADRMEELFGDSTLDEYPREFQEEMVKLVISLAKRGELSSQMKPDLARELARDWLYSHPDAIYGYPPDLLQDYGEASNPQAMKFAQARKRASINPDHMDVEIERTWSQAYLDFVDYVHFRKTTSRQDLTKPDSGHYRRPNQDVGGGLDPSYNIINQSHREQFKRGNKIRSNSERILKGANELANPFNSVRMVTWTRGDDHYFVFLRTDIAGVHKLPESNEIIRKGTINSSSLKTGFEGVQHNIGMDGVLRTWLEMGDNWFVERSLRQ